MTIISQKMSYLGTESAFSVLAKAEKLSRTGKDIINLGIGQPDFKTPKHICDAAILAINNGNHGYTPANGILPLRIAVAEDLKMRQNFDINPDNILILPGGKVTMFFAIQIFGEAGVEIIYPDPGFPIYASAINYSGAKAVPLPLLEKNNFAFSADKLISLINDKTRLIIINNPANPTGGVTSKIEMDKLAKGLEKFPHVAIMSDEIYSHMLYDNQQHNSMLAYKNLKDRVIILDGWSKTYAMTGWRLGYSIWPDNLIEHATKLAINCHSCVNAPTQFAGIAALEGSQQPVNEMMQIFTKRRSIIVDALNNLPGVSCIMPKGAFYAFANIKQTGMKSMQMQELLLNKVGVAVISGTSFGKYGEGYLRFSYANSTTNILTAISRIKSIL